MGKRKEHNWTLPDGAVPFGALRPGELFRCIGVEGRMLEGIWEKNKDIITYAHFYPSGMNGRSFAIWQMVFPVDKNGKFKRKRLLGREASPSDADGNG